MLVTIKISQFFFAPGKLSLYYEFVTMYKKDEQSYLKIDLAFLKIWVF